MTPAAFVAKWRSVELKERSASQEHFLDLCVLLEIETPANADPKGEWLTFEKGASKTGGGEGWGDDWRADPSTGSRLGDDEMLARVLALNQLRAAGCPA